MISVPVKTKTSVKFEVVRDGEVIAEQVTHNLVTSAGVIASSVNSNILFIGTGTTTPTYSDTQLANRIVIANPARQLNQVSRDVDELAKTLTTNTTIVYTYPLGAVAANISEFGVGSSATTLHTRGLVKDMAGIPTTITVTAQDVLVVTYSFDIVLSYAPIAFSVDIDGTPINGELSFVIGSGGGTFDWLGLPANGLSYKYIVANGNAASVYVTTYASNVVIGSDGRLANIQTFIEEKPCQQSSTTDIGTLVDGSTNTVDIVLAGANFNSEWRALIVSPDTGSNNRAYYYGGVLLNFTGPNYITKTSDFQYNIQVQYKLVQEQY
jgi:hypothetical protein